MTQIVVVDLGLGNIRNVASALAETGRRVEISNDPTVLEKAALVVVPGVGTFGRAMRELSSSGVGQVIASRTKEDKPMLGICLGLQIFFGESEEDEGVRGLGVIQGQVKSLPSNIHNVGWRQVRSNSSRESQSAPFEVDGKYWFNHRYGPVLPSSAAGIVLGSQVEQLSVVAGIIYGRSLLTQFHPEKSGMSGLNLLSVYTDWALGG